MNISIIIPTLNESENIISILDCLQDMRKRGHEVILVDGGSNDDTVSLASDLCDLVVNSKKGRAIQMSTGASRASGDVLWFLHADSIVDKGFDRKILDGLARSGKVWGRFDVSISGNHLLLGVISMMMNLRSRITGISTGDQGIFVLKTIYHVTGGFQEMALMEDIEFSKRMKLRSFPLCLQEKITTSGRRWESKGIIRTIWLMWKLRLLYAFGAKPEILSRMYT